MRFRSLPAIALLALLAACGGVSISFFYSTIDKAAHSGVDAFRLAVVGTPGAWAELWFAHIAPLAPAPPPPAIDFSSRMVVGVFLGPRPNACYAVRIDDIVSAADRVLVYFSERRPQPGEFCAQVITTPAHIVSVTRTSLPFEFVQTN